MIEVLENTTVVIILQHTNYQNNTVYTLHMSYVNYISTGEKKKEKLNWGAS